MRNCYSCGYCKKIKDTQYYCDDLDEYIDPDESPICSDENYNS